MTNVNIPNSSDPKDQAQKELIKKLEKILDQLLVTVRKRAKLNRGWDLSLTIGSIILTLTITVSGVLGEEVLGKNISKIIAGTLGAGLVAIQAVNNSIPIKQRSGGYRLIEAQLMNLEFDFLYKQYTNGRLDDTEIQIVLNQLGDLRREAAKLEGDPAKLKKDLEKIKKEEENA